MDKKVPSDAQLKEFWRQLTEAGGDEVDFARALLARYGKPAQPAVIAEQVVVYMYQDKQDYVVHGTVPKGTSLRPGINTLYTAPVAAQPSVPEPLKYGREWKDHYVTGWNNCRAAMLAAEQPQQDNPTPEEEEAWQRMERRS